MAYSYNKYTSNGYTKTYSSPPYLEPEHITVSVNDVALDETQYDLTGTVVNLTTAAPSGSTVLVRRSTSPSTRLVTFTSSYLDEDDLNTNANQMLYLAQESLDIQAESQGYLDDITSTEIIDAVVLASGQTVVNFTNSLGAEPYFRISGDSVDNTLLNENVDFTLDLGANQVTLTDSYPAGTVISVYGLFTAVGGDSYNTPQVAQNVLDIAKNAVDIANNAVDIAALEAKAVVSVTDFGAVGDGVTDDTAAIQAALDYWKDNDCVLVFPSGSEFLVSTTLLVDFDSTNTNTKEIRGYGSSISAPSLGNVLKFTVSGAATLVKDLIIQGLKIVGSPSTIGSALTLQGPLANNSFFYNCQVRDCKLDGYTGLSVLGNFFESTFQDNHISARDNAGYGIYVDTAGGSGTGSGGIISSLTFFQNTTRGGNIGLYSTAASTDVNIIGGTYLLAQREGISIKTAQGGHITGAHVESNWQSNPSLTATQAGIYVEVSGVGAFSVRNTYSICSSGQSHAVRAYVANNAVVVIEGGRNEGGLEFCSLNGLSTGAAILIGSMDYTSSTIKLTRLSGLRVSAPITSQQIVRLVNPTSVTPSSGGLWHVLLSSNTPTINAPSFTPAFGDELEFSFEQIGGGGITATWDAAYSVGSFVPTASFGKTSSIKFRYLNTQIAGGKWVVVSTGTM